MHFSRVSTCGFYLGTFQAQIHLVGNLVIWYSGSIAVAVFAAVLLFHLLRRRRACYDISQGTIQSILYIYFLLLSPKTCFHVRPIRLPCLIIEPLLRDQFFGWLLPFYDQKPFLATCRDVDPKPL